LDFLLTGLGLKEKVVSLAITTVDFEPRLYDEDKVMYFRKGEAERTEEAKTVLG